MEDLIMNRSSGNLGEIAIYQPDEVTRLEVKIDGETVWMTQEQIARLFCVKQPAISKHIRNIYSEGELTPEDTYSILEYMGNDGKQKYKTRFYNLDMILSIGYRVNSKNAVAFRRWATAVLKDYMLRGYCINQRINQLEDRFDRRMTEYNNRLDEHQQVIDFIVRTSLPPVEGVFFDGQIYDAYAFVSRLIRSAVKRIVLIDNYIDNSVSTMMDKRNGNVKAIIYTTKVSRQLQMDIQKHNAQYPQIEIHEFTKSHDRFLIIDEKVYLIGASIKDLGKKWFGFTLMESISAEEIMERLRQV